MVSDIMLKKCKNDVRKSCGSPSKLNYIYYERILILIYFHNDTIDSESKINNYLNQDLMILR